MGELKKLGRYELRRVLGKGAMGVVYEAYDPTLGRRVAIKTILRSAALDAGTEHDYSVRFVREAKAVARLNHPNIVQVHDFGVEDDVAYLVMEFIQGRELRDSFTAGEAFETGECVRIMGELLDALEFAHEAGVIHRDVKPANVMLDAQRRVKLADFGVARVQDSEHSAAGTMAGTPAYMSPEQIQGGKIDRRADVFAAGVILYQMLTGEQPFQGDGAWTVARQIMQDEPKPPSNLVHSVSPIFDEVVQRALAKSAAERFSSARQFAEALRAAHAGERSAQLLGPAPARSPVPEPKASLTEIEFWRSIQNSTDPAEFNLYLKQFPDGTYAGLARMKSDNLVSGRSLQPARQDGAANSDATVAIGEPRPAPARRTGTLAAGIALAAIAAAGYYLYSREPAPAPVQVPAAEIERIRKDIEQRIHREYADKSAAEQAAAAKAETEKAVQQRMAELQAAEKAKAEKTAQEKAAQEKIAQDKTTQERALTERAVLEKAAAEKVAAAKSAAEKAAAEKAAAEKAAADKGVAEKAAAEKLAADKAAAGKAAVAADAAMGGPGWPRVGDRWVYEVQEPYYPEKKHQLSVTVAAVSATGIRDVSTGARGEEISWTHVAAPQIVGVSPGIAHFFPYLRALQNPQANARWPDVVLKDLWACSASSEISCVVDARVAGRERVTVRAGSYDAWKVVATLQITSPYGRIASGEITYWYAEEVNRTVKYRFRSATSGTMSANRLWTTPNADMELLSYVPAGSR